MSNKPNWEKAKQAAHSVLIKHGINSYPINLVKIIKSYNNIKFITYSEMMKKRNLSLEEVIEANLMSEDGAIHYSAKRDSYIVAFNDLNNHERRKYWTLAHEFGHYILSHHKDSDKCSLARNEMTDEEDAVQEAEADFFARFLIANPPVAAKADLTTTDRMETFLRISYKASRSTLKYIRNSSGRGYNLNAPENIFKNFNTFIQEALEGNTCEYCDCFIADKDASYCPICAQQEFHQFYKGVDHNVFYPGLEVDANGKITNECPKCKNEELAEGDHCKICGTYLVNKCTDSISDDFGQEYPCETVGSGNSLHCHKCGGKMTFQTNGILKPWDEESDRSTPNT